MHIAARKRQEQQQINCLSTFFVPIFLFGFKKNKQKIKHFFFFSTNDTHALSYTLTHTNVELFGIYSIVIACTHFLDPSMASFNILKNLCNGSNTLQLIQLTKSKHLTRTRTIITTRITATTSTQTDKENKAEATTRNTRTTTSKTSTAGKATTKAETTTNYGALLRQLSLSSSKSSNNCSRSRRSSRTYASLASKPRTTTTNRRTTTMTTISQEVAADSAADADADADAAAQAQAQFTREYYDMPYQVSMRQRAPQCRKRVPKRARGSERSHTHTCRNETHTHTDGHQSAAAKLISLLSQLCHSHTHTNSHSHTHTNSDTLC